MRDSAQRGGMDSAQHRLVTRLLTNKFKVPPLGLAADTPKIRGVLVARFLEILQDVFPFADSRVSNGDEFRIDISSVGFLKVRDDGSRVVGAARLCKHPRANTTHRHIAA